MAKTGIATHQQSDSSLPENPSGTPLTPTSLLKSTSFVLSARISGAAFGISTQFFLAKLFTAEELGLFFVATGLAMVLAVVCTLGYPMLVPRIVAKSTSEQNPPLLAAFMARARADTMLMSVLLICLLLLAAWLMPLPSKGMQTSLIFAALTFPAFALLRLNGSLANAQKRFELGFLPDLFFRPLLFFSFIGVLWLNWEKLNLETILIGQIAIAAFLAMWQMYRVYGNQMSLGALFKVTQNPTDEQTTSWRCRAVPLMIVALFIGVFADLDIVITRLFLDDAMTGIFGICLKISLFVAFGIQAIHQLILRDIADALHAGDNRQVHHVMARANVLTLTGSVGALLVVMIFGHEVLGFFGEEFKAGFESLVILMLAQVVRAAAGPAAHILALSGHEKSCLPVFLICLVLLLVGNFVLIQMFGLLGAAATVLVVSALWAFWLTWLVKSKLGLKSSIIFA